MAPPKINSDAPVARIPRYSPKTSAAMSTVNGPSRFNNNDPLIADTSSRPMSSSTGATIPPATSMSATRGASARRTGVSRECERLGTASNTAKAPR